MICSEKELSILRNHRAVLAQQLAQVDALIMAATQTATQSTPQPAHDPIVQQRLALDAKADTIIGYWERTTGVKPPHNLMCSWITEYGRDEVARISNQMFAKHRDEKMTDRHQVAYVAKVLRECATQPVRQGVITI